jgi:hypothetical protein
MLTFWPQQHAYGRYLRCELPARVLGGSVRDIDAVRFLNLDVVEVNGDHPSVWQLLCNGARLEQVQKLMQAGVDCYVEVDDNYTRWDDRYANSDWVPGIPEDMITAGLNLHRRVAQLVSGVIVSTPYLADAYASLNANVTVCPNSVDPDDWKEPGERDDTLRIMWMASGWSHRWDQFLVQPALEWAAEQPGVEVYVFGAKIRSEKIIFVPWASNPQAYRDLMVELRPDVGVCPVAINDFSRGKSDLKPMEYAMAGAMSIVTPFEPYEPWVDRPEACLWAEDPDEWRAAVEWCVEHRDEVRQKADMAREYVLSERTITQCADSWLVATGQLAVV